MVKKAFALIVIALLIGIQIPSFAETLELSSIVKDKSAHVRTFIKGFTNESGQAQISIDSFTKSFENALLNRKSVNFELVKSPEASDIQISGIITKYQYLKSDPINSFAGAGGLILDAATIENYAELEVEFTVVNSRTNGVIWKEKVLSYVERTMTPEESIPLVEEKLSRKFLSKCFGKPK